MSPSQIPTPALPPSKRPPSSIAQVVQINGDENTDVAVDSPPADPTQAAPKRDVGPTAGQAKKDDQAGSRPAPPAGGGSGRKGAGKRVEAPAADSRKPTTVRKPILVNLDDELKQRMINTVGWTGPRTGLRSQQAFVRRAIAELCERFEREHNQGNPFDLVEDRTEA